MKRTFILALGLLIISASGIDAAFASGTEKKTVKPAPSGSATERSMDKKVDDKANAASTHGSGTERESISDDKIKDEKANGSTSERKAPKRPAGSGTERE